MARYFEDKVVWITGASSGIGREMAYQLSAQGARLILSGRNLYSLEQVSAQCDTPSVCLPFDLADFRKLEPIAKTAVREFGHVDLLINNGGQGCRSMAVDTDIDTDARIMQVNYLGNIALAKALLPHFLERRGGQFVVVSSLAGKFGTKTRSSYAASKHALHGFYESLNAEVYDQGIRVTMVCPGFVDTSLLERSWDGNGNTAPSISRVNKRMTAGDCAKQILRAASQEKWEVIIGESLKERISVDVKRYFPALFSSMIRKVNVS